MSRKWSFAARVAAARFCSRKTRASRWTPALLRWARRGERARKGESSHSTTQVHSHSFRGSWVTHLNLHFHLSAFFRASRSRTSPARSGSPASRSSSTSRSSQVSRGSSLPGPYATTRAPHSKVTATARFPRVDFRTSPRASRSWLRSQTTVVTTAVSHRGSDRVFAPIASAAHRSDRMQQVQPSVRAFTHRPARRSLRLSKPSLGRASEKVITEALREPARQTWRAARALARSATTARDSVSALPAWATQSPVDLVWRAPSDPSSTSSAHAARARPAGTVAATPLLQTPPAASRTSEQTIVRAAALEPGLAERLADDVIRRIDRRARIERERKGM